jgi:hypothetical protein
VVTLARRYGQMPKSKTRKGKGGSGNAFAKGYARGLKVAVVAALMDLYPDGPPDEETCPACALDEKELYGLAEVAREAFHVEAPEERLLRTVGGPHA